MHTQFFVNSNERWFYKIELISGKGSFYESFKKFLRVGVYIRIIRANTKSNRTA